MVRKDLVLEHKNIAREAVSLQCTHGDIITYPVAHLNLEVSSVVLHVRPAVADKLPVAVLLGTDIPELGTSLHIDPKSSGEESEDAVVTTRAQATARAESEAERQQRQEQSGVLPRPVE